MIKLRWGYVLFFVTFELGVGLFKSVGAKRDKTSFGLRSVLCYISVRGWACQRFTCKISFYAKHHAQSFGP